MRKKKLLALLLMVAVLLTSVGFPEMTSAAAEKKSDGTVIKVTDYGADPSGASDSTDAVVRALEAAKKTGGEVTLDFPKGEYRFDEDHASTRIYHTSNTSSKYYPEKKIGLLLEDMENVTIEGNGSTLLMYGDIMALAVVGSSDITMRNFVLDYKDADTIDISVVGTGENENGQKYADIFVPAAYNYEITNNGTGIQWQGEISEETGKPYWTWDNADFCAYLVVYKGYDRTVIRANDKNASNPFTGVDQIQKTGETTLRFVYSGELPTDVVEGNIYQLSNSALRRTAGAFFWESSNLSVENIDVHYLSGFGWLTQMCKNVEFKGVDFLPREGSGKYTTSNADQLHVAGCGGYFKVTDCNFSMAHDDPINVHGSYMRVEEIIDSRTLKMKYIQGQQGGFRQFHEGDEVLFYSRTYLESPDGQEEDRPFVVKSSVAPGEKYGDSSLDLVTEIVTFAEDLPEETLADLRKTVDKNKKTQPLYVAENITYTPEVTISGNLMKSIPTRGILCTTRKPVIIENNVFDNMAMASIYLSNDADDWYESGPIRNMVIRNNEFYVRPTGQHAVGTVSGIFIEPVTIPQWAMTGGEKTPKNEHTPVHKNITIEGNRFHMSNDNVVTANRVDGLTIKNNTIIHEDTPLLSVSAPAELGTGTSAQLKVSVDENILEKDVFRFNDCQNVLVEGNTYDEGMNLNIRTDNKMTAEDLRNRDGLTVNKSGGNIIASESKVQLISSDPSVAYIDGNRQLVGVRDGSVTVQAYLEKNGAIIKSEPIQVQVGEAFADALILSTDTVLLETKDSTAKITSNRENVEYEVLDPLTGAQTDKGRISADGTYTAKKDGTVIVRGTSGSATAEVLLVNSFDVSYGDPSRLEETITVTEPTENGIVSDDEFSVGIIPQSNGNGIWAGTPNRVNNIVNVPISEELWQNLRVQVDVSGLVKTGGGWNSSGLMLYTDVDNYLFVGKRNHMQGIALIQEENSRANEASGNAEQNALTETTFEFEVMGSTAVIRYIDADGKWKEAASFEIAYLQKEGLKLGLISWLNGGADYRPVYKNIRIGAADATTTEEMKNSLEPVPLYQPFANERPQADQVVLTAAGVNEPAAVSYDSFDSEDGNAVSALFCWELVSTRGEKNIEYTTVPEYTPKTEGTLTVTVVGIDSYGKPGSPVTSKAVSVKTEKTGKEELGHLYMNGNLLEGFRSDKYEYSYYVPENTESIRISYDEADAGIRTEISGGGKKEVLETENSVIMAYAGSFTIKRGNVTYTVNVKKLKNNDNGLKALKVGKQTVDLADEIKKGTDSYFLQTEEDAMPLHIEACDDAGGIRVTNTYFEKEVADSNDSASVFDAQIEMTAGINAYYIYVTAADGITTREVKLYLFRDAYSDADLEAISINGKALADFAGDQEEYLIRVSPEESTRLSVQIEAKEGQQTSITCKGQRTEGTSAEPELKDGLNRIVIANAARDLWTKRFYTINVIVERPENTDLLDLTVDGKTIQGFVPGVTEYEMNNNNGILTVGAQSQLSGAEVKIYAEKTGEEVSGRGTVEHEFKIYEGENRICVDVKGTDGKSIKTYAITVYGKGLVYASDVVGSGSLEGIENTGKKVGYGNITLDGNVAGAAKISLPDEKGNPVVFEKGLGTHAASEVTFVFEKGHEFTKFEAYAGVDYVQYQTKLSSVTFEVWVDGVKKYDSREVLGDVLLADTPMQFVSVDITDAKEVKLITTDGGDGVSYDHSEWADACFIRKLETAPEIPKNPFTDVAEDAYYFRPVMWAVSEGITTGVGETGLFMPDRTCSRAHVVTFLWRQAGSPEPSDNTDISFTDVTKEDYFYKAVMWAAEQGITTGYGNTDTFKPYDTCTRANTIAMLWRASGKPEAAEGTKNPFSDVAEDAYYYKAVMWAVSEGITTGFGNTDVFHPHGVCTRANVLTFLYRSTVQ